jgi:hypothetical protein
MGPLGVPEIFIIMGILATFGLIPLAAGIWAIVTLQRIRSGQETIRLRLELLERTVQRSSGQ